jgi:hypothetical protein
MGPGSPAAEVKAITSRTRPVQHLRIDHTDAYDDMLYSGNYLKHYGHGPGTYHDGVIVLHQIDSNGSAGTLFLSAFDSIRFKGPPQRGEPL